MQNSVNLGLKRRIFMSKTHMFLRFYVFGNAPVIESHHKVFIFNIEYSLLMLSYIVQVTLFHSYVKKQQLVLAEKKSRMCPVPIPFGHPTDQPTDTTTHQPTNPPIPSFNSKL
jgi:hypothetical protein